jgi:hypothetical protein
VHKIRNKENVESGNLFPLISAIKKAVKLQIDPEWLFGKGIDKAIKIRIPKAIIISDSININKDIKHYLKDCIYVQ